MTAIDNEDEATIVVLGRELARLKGALSALRAEVLSLHRRKVASPTGLIETRMRELGLWEDAAPPAGGGEVVHAPLAEMREAILQCWYWFDDHDDRMTSAELWALLRRLVAA